MARISIGAAIEDYVTIKTPAVLRDITFLN
jgi:hypothetical protein